MEGPPSMETRAAAPLGRTLDGLYTYPAAPPPQPVAPTAYEAARKGDAAEDLQGNLEQLEGNIGKLPSMFQEGILFWVGHLICLLTVVEGVLVVYTLYYARRRGLNEAIPQWSGLGSQNPLQGLLVIVLFVVGYGDLVCACLQSFSLWFWTALELPRYLEKVRFKTARLAPYSVGVLLWWRSLVTLVAAPFFGIMLAFHSPNQAIAPAFVCAFIYIAASLLVVYALVCCTHAARVQSRLLQLDGALSGALATPSVTATSQSLLAEGDNAGLMIFGCIPLDLLVTLYMLAIGIACLVWFIQMVVMQTKVVGGWLFVPATSTEKVPQAPSIIEIVVCAATFTFTVIGFLGIMSMSRSEREEEYLMVTLNNDLVLGTADPRQTASLAAELDATRQLKRESSNAMLTYLVVTLLRVVIFIPITGMEIFERNLCGFTSSAMQSLYARSPADLGKARCTHQDVWAIVGIVIFLLADLAFLRGVYLLWLHNHNRCGNLNLQKTIEKTLNYGTSALSVPRGALLTPGLRAA